MKKSFVVFTLLLLFLTGKGFSQSKIGYVDSDAIMDQLSDAQDARQQLDALIQEWQGELSKMESDWKTKYNDYEKRKLIMTDQTRIETESELTKMEQKITDYREKKFGTNGELFQKQDEFMKPVQNKVFTAIKKVADKEDYDFVFDRSGGVLMLYAKDKYDITSLVLKELNVTATNKPGAKPGSSAVPSGDTNQGTPPANSLPPAKGKDDKSNPD
jgi:outer membrane protein